jgi:phosphoglycolate phosphatase
MKYDTIIFDLDGTLLNTLDDLRDSLNTILTRHGYPARTLDEVRSFVGNGVKKLVSRSLPEGYTEDELTCCVNEFREYYKENMQNKTRPYDGIIELLTKLKKLNYKLAIVSNKFDAAVKDLSKDYFGDMVPVAIGESVNIRRKPAPDSVYKAIEELGADISRAVYVGDSDTDAETAKNAGIPCIGVTWGFRSRQVLESCGVVYIVDSPDEILSII